MKTLKLALDWTPNVNHVGFYVAKDKGFYPKSLFDLEIINPEKDNYSITPAKKVELGLADFALCPTESLISYQTKSNTFPLVGLSSIFKEDLSAIAVLKSQNINSPKDLHHKIYASYQARYEDGIVKAMIKNDGGEPQLKITYPSKLGIWDNLVKGEADATWIFMNWEGIQAESMKVELNYFKLSDYQIPYSYSPVIATNETKIDSHFNEYKLFLEATREGYFYAKKNPQEAAEILSKHIPEKDRNINLVKAIKMSCNALGTYKTWGKIDLNSVDQFLDWLRQHNLEQSKIPANQLFREL